MKTERGIDSRSYPDWWVYTILSLLLTIIAAIHYARTRAARSEVKDSDAFAQALQIWTPVVAQKASAPRAIKRFGNRLRYFAMLQQAEVPEPTTEERAEAWVRKWVVRDAEEGSETPVARVDAVAEHRLVALGAMQTVYGDEWRSYVENASEFSSKEIRRYANAPNATAQHYTHNAREVSTITAVHQYTQLTNSSWPPSAAELDAFERSLKGIRLGGDVTVLSDQNSNPSFSPQASMS